MNQNALTVIVPIEQGAIDELRRTLEVIGNDVEGNPLVRFRDSPSTHFARFAILEHDPGRGPRLLFSSNHDGGLPDYARELAQSIGAGLEQIWGSCRGYAKGTAMDGGRLLEFFQRHSLPAQAFYVACPGATVAEILESIQLRKGLDRRLDGPDAMEVFAELAPLIPNTPPPRASVASGPLAALGSLLGRVAEWLAGIRTGPPSRDRRVAAREELVRIEDRPDVVQNQMTVVSPIRPRLWSRIFIRLVFLLVSMQARRSRGSLSGVATIHFARWVIIDDGAHLLFESNYDGSWESYIDDFVDFASTGMNVIWGTAVDFPSAGCRDIEAFKQIIRRYQRVTQVFYSAYPESSVKNNLNDLSLARAVRQQRPDEAVRRLVTGSNGTSG